MFHNYIYYNYFTLLDFYFFMIFEVILSICFALFMDQNCGLCYCSLDKVLYYSKYTDHKTNLFLRLLRDNNLINSDYEFMEIVEFDKKYNNFNEYTVTCLISFLHKPDKKFYLFFIDADCLWDLDTDDIVLNSRLKTDNNIILNNLEDYNLHKNLLNCIEKLINS